MSSGGMSAPRDVTNTGGRSREAGDGISGIRRRPGPAAPRLSPHRNSSISRQVRSSSPGPRANSKTPEPLQRAWFRWIAWNYGQESSRRSPSSRFCEALPGRREEGPVDAGFLSPPSYRDCSNECLSATTSQRAMLGADVNSTQPYARTQNPCHPLRHSLHQHSRIH